MIMKKRFGIRRLRLGSGRGIGRGIGKRRSKLGQVWVETVIYTLIGLTIIGLVMAITLPKIQQMVDKSIVEQTITSFNNINSQVMATQRAAGNSRLVSLRIKRGEILIDSEEDVIVFKLEESKLRYTQPGRLVPQGDIDILTQENGRKYDISLVLNYTGQSDITFEGENIIKELTQAPTAYEILIENKGQGVLDFMIV